MVALKKNTRRRDGFGGGSKAVQVNHGDHSISGIVIDGSKLVLRVDWMGSLNYKLAVNLYNRYKFLTPYP